MSILFESDSEYERLLIIQTILSYKLNHSIQIFDGQSEFEEVAKMTKRLRMTEDMAVSLSDERKRLDGLLSNVIEETLKQIFKEEGATYIFIFMKTSARLKQEQIAKKPEVFSVELKKILSSGAPVIEKMILKNLYSKLELKFKEKKGYGFSDYIEELKKYSK